MRPSLRTLLQRWRRLSDDAGGEVTVGVDLALASLAIVLPGGRVDLATMVPTGGEVWLNGKRIYPQPSHPAQQVVDELAAADRATASALQAELRAYPGGVANHESPAPPTATKALGVKKNRAKWVENDVANDVLDRVVAIERQVVAALASFASGTPAGNALSDLVGPVSELRSFVLAELIDAKEPRA